LCLSGILIDALLLATPYVHSDIDAVSCKPVNLF
jgi:hypothetical protein